MKIQFESEEVNSIISMIDNAILKANDVYNDLNMDDADCNTTGIQFEIISILETIQERIKNGI